MLLIIKYVYIGTLPDSYGNWINMLEFVVGENQLNGIDFIDF